jgi:hypothetical protein
MQQEEFDGSVPRESLNKFSAIFFVTGKVCRAGGGVRKR